MNWKFLLFVTAAVSGVKADPCPSVNQCPRNANTNFNFVGSTTSWYWTSGTVPGASIDDTGLVTFNLPGAKFPINGICIQWKDWSYTYVTRPSQQASCDLKPFTESINNAWGYS
ncbi:hypothetical protein V8E54_006122 [Elaphomyces granulatus]|jgi:hypothetical protein